MSQSLRNPGKGSVPQVAGMRKGMPLPVSVAVGGDIMGEGGERR
jgi:hypothetical protein